MQLWLMKKLRENGLSQAALARELGLSPRSLCNKFQGKQPFLYWEVVGICRRLHIENPLQYDWGKQEKSPRWCGSKKGG